VTAIWDVLAKMEELTDEERLDNFITFLFAGTFLLQYSLNTL
jgi:hypothetical protein